MSNAVRGDGDIPFAVVPEVIFNADGVTLDDMTLKHVQHAAGLSLHVVSCEASEFLPQITQLITRAPVDAPKR